MNNDIKKILLCLSLPALISGTAMAQKISGQVLSSDNKPVADAVISSPGAKTVRTDKNGRFSIDGIKDGSVLQIWHDGYFTKHEFISNSSDNNMIVYVIEADKYKYNETKYLPTGCVDEDESLSGISNVHVKDFYKGSMSIDNSLKGEIPGLNVIGKSGMPGEGSYMQIQGIKSLVAETSPLVVINGVPFMPDANESQATNGYSRSLFQALNNLDIRNVTVLKGADAAAYGSMGSNGVIMIETKQASAQDMNTRIGFSAIYGFNWNNRRIPLLNSNQYKSYLEDIGLTYYDNMEQFFNDFSFLSDPSANNANLYKFNTDWQDEIYRNSSSMDYLFRIEGGDNIAKYNISLGYMSNEGTLKNTKLDRYNAQINASVLVSKKFEIRANINTSYLNGKLQEQGMSLETNPMLAAYRRSPLLSPYQSDIYGNLIGDYSKYWYGAIENHDFVVSNPLSIVNNLKSKNRQYDVNANVRLIYHPILDLTLTGVVGMYYNYNQEEAFIPGKDNQDIVPLFDQYGSADNSVRTGTNHTFSIFFGADANYNLNLNENNKFKFNLGWQAVVNSYEYDAAFGRNSNNDFYQTMGDAQKLGKYFSGYNNKWNWMNFYAHADYTLAHALKLGLTASLDGASSIGGDAARFSIYPAGEAVLMAKQLGFLRHVDFVNKLNIFAKYGVTGNSRFSSKFGKYYYTSRPYQTIAGIVRANVPNTNLKAERDDNLSLGFETSLLRNRIQLGFNYYNTKARNVLISGVTTAVLGTSPYYSNDAKINSNGIELSLNVSPVYSKDFKWTVGGTLTTLNNTLKSLGMMEESITTLSDDAEIISRIGNDPYAFYGYKTNGVYSTTEEASTANLVNRNGVAYQAGDVKYIDRNNDGRINDDDKVILGSATPDFFGGIFTRFEYKNFALDVDFAYSVGNDAYNAVRRVTESGKDFSNQNTALLRRWTMEGQVTNIPRVSWNDKVGNNDMSDRWVEDASYLKLRNITLSYSWNKPLWKFIQSGTVFVTGENLITITDYLGLDPEFSYSYSAAMQGVDYAKVAAPRSFKIGVNLKF
jgi:TonB-linked SusC/RagA family outer membrane protein